MNLMLFIFIAASLFVVLSVSMVSLTWVSNRQISRMYQSGRRFTELELWADAIRAYNDVLARDSGHARAHYGLGYVLYHGFNNTAEAIRELSAAISIDSDFAAAYYTLGHLQFYREFDYENAGKNLAHASELDPGLSQAYNTLGILEMKRQNWDSALKHLETALQTGHESGPVLCNLAIVSMFQGKTAEAVLYGEKYVEQSPLSCSAHNTLGNIYGAARRPREAIQEFMLSLKLNPENWIVHFWLGCVYLQTGKCTGAVKAFHNALRLHPGYALAYYNLAICYETLNMRPEARKYIEKSIELNPKLGENLLKG